MHETSRSSGKGNQDSHQRQAGLNRKSESADMAKTPGEAEASEL